mmetsp:Transcript_85823/g.188422  ORF Transcript_85823/g.188422 Transcript_85823/m.188422 type:complete len:763 (-) Transcript_85823:71-2359(-)
MMSHHKSPARASVPATPGSGVPAMPLLAMLLNTGTKEEGEEFLDYYYPQNDPQIQAILPMKGVFLASCGVMQSACGQPVDLMSFGSADSSKQYKTGFQEVEGRIMCIVLPASTPDAVVRFFVTEAIQLVLLRFGSLMALSRTFKQLDPILRGLSVAWSRLQYAHNQQGSVSSAASVIIWQLHGSVPVHSFGRLWQSRIDDALQGWQSKVQSVGSGQALATLDGYALFLDQFLISTTLERSLFEASIRLSLLEGELGVEPEAHRVDERCHSLFLDRSMAAGSGMMLPSHQYSLIRCGPWLFFVLWKMKSPQTGESHANPGEPTCSSPISGLFGAAAIHSESTCGDGADPFATDLSHTFLSSLALPDEYVATLAAQHAQTLEASKNGRRTPTRSPGSGHRSKRAFSLPCPHMLKPLLSRSGSGSLRNSEPRRSRPYRFLYAMELQTNTSSSSSASANLSNALPASPSSAGAAAALSRPRPRQTASDHCWPPPKRTLGDDKLMLPCPLDPETLSRFLAEPCLDWMSNTVVPLLTREWSELDSLLLQHVRRKRAWSRVPKRMHTSHPLVNAVKGAPGLLSLWEDVKQQTERGAALLGSGESWRFQVGAPFDDEDLSRILGLGCLSIDDRGAGTWFTLCRVDRGCKKERDEGPCAHRLLLQASYGDTHAEAGGTGTSMGHHYHNPYSRGSDTPISSPGLSPSPSAAQLERFKGASPNAQSASQGVMFFHNIGDASNTRSPLPSPIPSPQVGSKPPLMPNKHQQHSPP